MKTKIVLVFVVLCVGSLSAYGADNGNGVFVQVGDSVYDIGGSMVIKRVEYACDGGSSYRQVARGAGLLYCSQSAHVKMHWLGPDASGIHRIPKTVPPEEARATPLEPKVDTGSPSAPTSGSSEQEVDDSDSSHCAQGEAVIWDIEADAIASSYARMRSECRLPL